MSVRSVWVCEGEVGASVRQGVRERWGECERRVWVCEGEAG